MPHLTILLSHERSGSHFLADFVGSLSGVQIFDEVCNPGAVSPDTKPSFHGFRANFARDNPSYLRTPNYKAQTAFVRAYLSSLMDLAAGKSAFVDIKYSHVHLFEELYCHVLGKPFLLRQAESDGVNILHLYREGVVESAVSSFIARARQTYHNLNGARRQKEAVFVDTDAVVTLAALRRDQSAWFKGHLAGQNNVMTVTYEQLCSDLRKAGDLDAALAAHVGGAITECAPHRYQKVTLPLPEAVSNYSELLAACKARGLPMSVVEHQPRTY